MCIRDSPTGEGVIGANVKVVDSTEGTITDMDGNSSLMVTPNARLSISLSLIHISNFVYD